MHHKVLLALGLALGSALSAAQTEIFESKDQAGPVFSDVPSAGAKPLELSAPNLSEAPQLPPSSSAPVAAPPPYRRLTIRSPVNQDTVWANTALRLQVQVSPALRARQGDALIVRLDGNLVGQGFSTTTISIQAADWERLVTDDNLQHSLQVAVADRNGNVLIESAPILVFARRHIK